MGERVAFIQTNNIQAESPDAIAAHLHASASRGSDRLKGPYLHFIVSFDAADARAGKVPDDVQREIAGKVIERMGLAEHHGAVFGHKDTQNPHMHFLFSRVHPETLRAWDNSKCGARLTEIVREVAREHGLNVSRSQEHGAERISEAEYHEARREGRPPFQTFSPEQRAEIRGQTLPAFREATGWADLTERLQAQGLRLGMAGKGSKAALYVYSDTHKAKLSDVFGKEKDIRTGKLAERFGQRFTDYARESGLAAPERPERAPERPEATRVPRDALDVAGQAHKAAHEHRSAEYRAAIAERDAYRAEVNEARQAAQQAQASNLEIARLVGIVERAEIEAERSRAEIMGAIAEAYADPAAAARAWQEYEAERERAGKLSARAFEPERFGPLRGSYRAWVKNAERRKALAAVERMKKARARFFAERERAESAKQVLPRTREQARRVGLLLRGLLARTGDTQAQDARLAFLNQKVSLKAAALKDLEASRAAAFFGEPVHKRPASMERQAAQEPEPPRGSILVAHGPAPYQNKEKARDSYFVTVRHNDGKEYTIWGKGLANAIDAAGVKKGDRVTLKVEAQQEVTIKEQQADGTEREIKAKRNVWTVQAEGRDRDRDAERDDGGRERDRGIGWDD